MRELWDDDVKWCWSREWLVGKYEIDFIKKGRRIVQLIYARYNKYYNSIDITTFNGYLLRIDCNKAEHRLKVTPNSQCALNALAIDEPLEYARLYLDGEMQAWVDAEDSLEVW